ncbi:hypothetical protein F5883DRAFT_504700 [Diaporthe sp. PMI_573]|nr:hypothetical protein F5883DRAFT_504700 [Diaporthaceae sp. PMI_573]
MSGFLIPPWYQAVAPDLNDLLIATIIWGFSIGCGLFSAFKAIRQSKSSWERSHRIRPYVVMIWAEWLSSMTMGVLAWVFLRGFLKPSFQLFFILVCTWVIQVLMQIIINRISLLMMHRSRAERLKWTVAAILGLINISVFCIWIPAHLQISQEFIKINDIWDRIEKVIFLFIDAGLNFYFIYLIRAKLIANGLSKYMPLFRFNLLIVGVSMALDITLIGVMSLPNGFVYVQFHPLVYLLKLHIEMNIADLIVKVVKETNHNHEYSGAGTELHTKHNTVRESGINTTAPFHARSAVSATYVHAQPSAEPVEESLKGIKKTISTTVLSRPCDDDEFGSESSSTRQLRNEMQVRAYAAGS